MQGEKFFLDTPQLSSDLEYLLQSKQVSQAAIAEELTREMYAPLNALAYAFLRDGPGAMQVACRAIVEATLTYDHYRPEIGVKTWLFGLAVNLLRKRSGGMRWMHSPREANEFQQALARLKPTLRLALLMHYGHRLSLAETALALGETEAAIRLGLDNARQALPPTMLEEDIPQHIEAHWPIRSLSTDEMQQSEQIVLSQVKARQQRRRFSLRLKELALGMAALLAVAIFAFYTSRAESNAAPTPKTTSEDASASRAEIANTTHFSYSDGRSTVTIRDAASSRQTGPGATPAPSATTTTAFPSTPERVTLNFSNVSWGDVFPDASASIGSSGSTSLGMVLKFLGWAGDPQNTLKALQPNPLDQTVLPYELQEYVADNAGGHATLLRFGGTPEILVKLLETGTPIIIQRGLNSAEGWTGRYEVIGGYERGGAYPQFTTWAVTAEGLISDTLNQRALLTSWRAFNYSYLIVYPNTKSEAILEALGEQADETANLQWAANLASKEIYSDLDGQELFFAWFNRGVSLAYLDDYRGAAEAFDEASAIFNNLALHKQPISLYWHQTRPYWAYYYSGRYQDVVDLADYIIAATGDNPPEEAYYWRALAREALGDIQGAKADLQAALALNPNFAAGLAQLRRLENGG